MKILFLTTSHEDYLADSLLHGLRAVLGTDVVDFPKADFLYRGFVPPSGRKMYGNGFTLYNGILDDIPIDRLDIDRKIHSSYFDAIIFGNIWSQHGLILQYLPWLNSSTVLLDGADSPRAFPFRKSLLKQIPMWTMPNLAGKFQYLKRELTEETITHIAGYGVPSSMRKHLRRSQYVHPIAFSFPEEKITSTAIAKVKEFPQHIVDSELATKLQDASTNYPFDREEDYYHDLQKSRFGISTKRAGWDCMRHYEIAANGAVICFRSLDQKPETCAPHGLCAENCVMYDKPVSLLDTLSKLSDSHYESLRNNSLSWISQNTTKRRAVELLDLLKSLSKSP